MGHNCCCAERYQKEPLEKQKEFMPKSPLDQQKQLARQLIMEGEPYFDRDFPSNSESLMKPDDIVSDRARAEFGKIVWRRARDIPELSRELFSESEI